jgi:hypothetical protein
MSALNCYTSRIPGTAVHKEIALWLIEKGADVNKTHRVLLLIRVVVGGQRHRVSICIFPGVAGRYSDIITWALGHSDIAGSPSGK